MSDLLGATVGRSVLLVTHDLEGPRHFDEVVVLVRGQVVERGTHATLVRGQPATNGRPLALADGPMGEG